MNPDIFGFLAAFLTTIAYFPQAIKVYREKHTKSISLGMYSMITTGIGCWFIYGILIDDWALILANGITFVLALFILTVKIKQDVIRR